MVSTKHCEHGCGGFSSTHNEDHYYRRDIFSMTAKPTRGSFMAEEDIRIGAGDDECEEANVGTSDSNRCFRGMGLRDDDGDREWLQLGIGSGGGGSSSRDATIFPETVGDRTTPTLVPELNLFPDRSAVITQTEVPPILPISYTTVYSRDMSWGLWNVVGGVSTSGITGTSRNNNPQMMPPSMMSYLPRQHPQLMYVSGSGSSLDFPTMGVERRSQGGGRNLGEEMSVMNPLPSPPRRLQIGLWFVLQASHENQSKESLLPQIPKSYLRIKDGSMTIRLLMRYLVSKLVGLVEESEVVITCKGHVLQPYLTLRHVRDNIWCARNVAAVLQDSTTDHVMTLQYRRRT